jgi:prepilin-type N-terminal cleavage/methylation domain-containing protein
MKEPRLQQHTKKGFTLIEIMVATSIFMIIMLMAMGALVTTSDTAKRSQALRTAMDNVNFAMESVTRSLRIGREYTCVTSSGSVYLPATANADCSLASSGGSAIIFTQATHAAGSRDTAYQLAQRSDGTYALERCEANVDPSCSPLVSSDINIEKLKFFVNGSRSDDGIQPSVYILMKGTVTIKGESTTFALQTMTSQRNPEY